jgi:membrane-associated protease RseP (regulator of RpoE activity)
MTRAGLVGVFVLCLLGAARAASAGPEGRPMPPPEGRGRIGIQVQPMTPELREHMKAPSDAGVLVVRVEPGSPAAAAGVEVGDVVTRAGGDPVDGPHDLIARVAQVPEGELIALELVHDGKTRKLDVAPQGAPLSAESFEHLFPGGFHHGMEALDHRLDDIERRLDELERRTPDPKPG